MASKKLPNLKGVELVSPSNLHKKLPIDCNKSRESMFVASNIIQHVLKKVDRDILNKRITQMLPSYTVEFII